MLAHIPDITYGTSRLAKLRGTPSNHGVTPSEHGAAHSRDGIIDERPGVPEKMEDPERLTFHRLKLTMQRHLSTHCDARDRTHFSRRGQSADAASAEKRCTSISPAAETNMNNRDCFFIIHCRTVAAKQQHSGAKQSVRKQSIRL